MEDASNRLERRDAMPKRFSITRADGGTQEFDAVEEVTFVDKQGRQVGKVKADDVRRIEPKSRSDRPPA